MRSRTILPSLRCVARVCAFATIAASAGACSGGSNPTSPGTGGSASAGAAGGLAGVAGGGASGAGGIAGASGGGGSGVGGIGGLAGASGGGASGAGGIGGLAGAGGTRLAVTQLVSGGSHTCALLSDGTVKCWGRADHGTLGYGNTQVIGDDELPSSVGPVSVTTTPGVTVAALAAGASHTCALLSDGTVKCWGLAKDGQLGYGNTQDIGDDELPSSVGPVSVTTTPGVTVTKLTAGYEHTCALLSDATVKCWGGNFEGELGYGNNLRIGDDELPSSVGPVSVTTTPGVSVTGLVGGVFETCAFLSDSTVKCWGANDSGQLGYGNTDNIGDNELVSSVGPIAITTTAGVTAVGLAEGGDFTCAVLSDGTAKCWGENFDGTLGYGNTTNIGDNELPSSVGSIAVTTTPGVTVKQLAAGDFHTCALLSDGTVNCWGENFDGAAGYGNTGTIGDDELPSSIAPISVTTAPGVTAVGLTSGDAFTCALLSDGTVKCWGHNDFGQLGIGNTKNIGDDELPSSVGAVQLAVR